MKAKKSSMMTDLEDLTMMLMHRARCKERKRRSDMQASLRRRMKSMKQISKISIVLILVIPQCNNHIYIDKLDLINNLNSIKLLAISEAFENFPNE